jgi:hypothetical protein
VFLTWKATELIATADQLLAAWCAVQEVAAAPVLNGNGAAAAVEQPGEKIAQLLVCASG